MVFISIENIRAITVNQIGYPLKAKKVAVFSKRYDKFKVINKKTNEMVYNGYLSEAIDDRASGKIVYLGDFSHLTTDGSYQIVAGNECSSPFYITEDPYEAAKQGVLKAFYFFRCGTELTEEYAEEWTHKTCHIEKGIVFDKPETQFDGTGGWHDAGDYGKYTVAGAKALADLLLAYELYPEAFKKSIPLPETDGIIPDILHESRYELEWLLKMQDLESGGVYHKLTTLHFPGLNIMPEDDVERQYFAPISATATGTFTAVMAMAARVYEVVDYEFSVICLERAKKAWKWLMDKPEVPGFKNPPEITTGEYGDGDVRDERYWAAAELFRTVGEVDYHNEFREWAKEDFDKYSLGWADMGGYGTVSYLLNGKKAGDSKLFEKMKNGLIRKAEQLVEDSSSNGYLISLHHQDYIWGSNMVLMNYGMLLLFAYHLTGDKRFEDCALDHVHYLFGRNVLDISYVTGFGNRSVSQPHHRPSVGDVVDAPIPGLIAGGPDSGLHDEYVKKHLQGKPPAQCFVDHKDSYSTNEVTIYWNSPAVFVLSHWSK